jgi:hypothetical protein
MVFLEDSNENHYLVSLPTLSKFQLSTMMLCVLFFSKETSLNFEKLHNYHVLCEYRLFLFFLLQHFLPNIFEKIKKKKYALMFNTVFAWLVIFFSPLRHEIRYKT